MVDKSDRMQIRMDLEFHDLIAEQKESCLMTINPIKVFKIRDQELINTLEENMGKGDDDDW